MYLEYELNDAVIYLFIYLFYSGIKSVIHLSFLRKK